MSIRTAMQQSVVVTFAVLVAFLWVLFTAIRVFGAMSFGGIGNVGQTGVAGVIGLVIMAIFLGLLVMVFGELSQLEPGPQTWPPRE